MREDIFSFFLNFLPGAFCLFLNFLPEMILLVLSACFVCPKVFPSLLVVLAVTLQNPGTTASSN